jgi:hypothetical protein
LRRKQENDVAITASRKQNRAFIVTDRFFRRISKLQQFTSREYPAKVTTYSGSRRFSANLRAHETAMPSSSYARLSPFGAISE